MIIKDQKGLEGIHLWSIPDEVYLDKDKWIIEISKI